ncbi:hypothetical protein [Algoriphagus sp.]|uniref:hypothetical protein n=1 Tax=Algoriphagus sp. TaxID=1872435 RepID=UPI00391D6542
MLKFFRKIRQKLLEANMGDSHYRDLIWVEQKNIKAVTVPLGTGYNGKFAFGKNHIAYLPTGQAGLRHAIPDYISGFYPYFVPTGHLLH